MAETLNKEFDDLAHALRQVISLLGEHEERFWRGYLERGLPQVERGHLSGATFVLGCFGGVDTFSDFELRHRDADTADDALARRNANARLTHLRNAIFESASAIASRRHW